MRMVAYLLLAGLGIGFASEAWARIKLVSLPVRERVEIQLDHANQTLVEEERIVPLLAGVNQVDFAWTNTQIEADSLILQVLTPYDEQVEVLSSSYPPNENAVVWQLSAREAGAVRIRLSYVLHGLDKQFSYRALTAADEKTLSLKQEVRVRNYAKEDFADAGLWFGFEPYLRRPLSFAEDRQFMLAKHADIPVHKTYTADVASHGYLNPAQQKLNIPMHYVLKNRLDEGLGKATLPQGKVRIYQQDADQSEAFIGEDWGQRTAIDDEMPLYLGLAQDIVVKRTIAENQRHQIAGNLYEYRVTVRYEIENFKTTPVTLDIVEQPRMIRDELFGNNGRDVSWSLGKTTTLGKQPDPEYSDFNRLVFHVPLQARAEDGKAEKQTETLQLIFHHSWR